MSQFIPNLRRSGYNKFATLPLLSKNCIDYLIENDEDIWKLLKHNTPDAWNKPDLSLIEKTSLIYSGQEDTTLYRVFMDNGTPDAWKVEDTILRISPYAIVPENKTVATVSILFEVYSHYKINTLSNYQTRVDTIVSRLLEVLNGIEIGTLGQLYFDKMGAYDARVYQASQIPFKGKNMLMAVKVG